MYEIIKNHKNPREIYVDTLYNRDKVERTLAEDLEKSFWQKLQDRLDMVKETPLPYNYQEPQEAWRALRITRDPSDFSIAPKTGIPSETFEKILDRSEERRVGKEGRCRGWRTAD